MYAEMEDQKALQLVKDRLYDYVTREKIELNSTTYYTLALVCSYRGEFAQALEYLIDRSETLEIIQKLNAVYGQDDAEAKALTKGGKKKMRGIVGKW